MKSQTPQGLKRRRHDARLKTAVIAECREPGASVAAVAQTYGLNANLVRKWLVGRGLKRCGLQDPRLAGDANAMTAPIKVPAVPFVAVQLPAPAPTERPCEIDEVIQVELTRADAKLIVRWPASQASGCASWLGELAGVLTR
jgi:transposase